MRNVVVIDIGKTNIKVVVVDIAHQQEIAVRKSANTVQNTKSYPHFDTEEHWSFILESLKGLSGAYEISGVSVTTHGASIVLLDDCGALATPILDYEYAHLDEYAPEYDSMRPDFAATGSPRLGMGLNVGAQLHWLLHKDPMLLARTKTVLTYPQYWVYRLSGVLCNEVTSLGCHTDLWCPQAGEFSPLVARLGLSGKMAPVRKAIDPPVALLPEIAEKTGLKTGLPVAVGIHDSNASLYPHLLSAETPFSVISTGTWVIVFSIGGEKVTLDAGRDTLINVDAFGHPVYSARFMGGREYDLMTQGYDTHYRAEDIQSVLEKKIMLFPAVDPRSGPFQGRKADWNVAETTLNSGARYVALCYYLALMTAECLDLTGAQGSVIVEGPFSQNRLYLEMLEAAVMRPVVAAEGSVTGTSIGAALLLQGGETTAQVKVKNPPVNPDARLQEYAQDWRLEVSKFMAKQ